MVTQDEDCFSVQCGGRACGRGEDWSGTNIVVIKEAIQTTSRRIEGDLMSTYATFLALASFDETDSVATLASEQLSRCPAGDRKLAVNFGYK